MARSLTEADLQAVVDLVLEREKSKRKIKVKIKPIARGCADHLKNEIIIPVVALTIGEDYAIYYVIHELSHFFASGHKADFKAIENRLLTHWELSIRRMKAYPRTLYSKGDVVYLRTRTGWHTWKTLKTEMQARAWLTRGKSKHPRLQWRIEKFYEYWLVQWLEV